MGAGKACCPCGCDKCPGGLRAASGAPPIPCSSRAWTPAESSPDAPEDPFYKAQGQVWWGAPSSPQWGRWHVTTGGGQPPGEGPASLSGELVLPLRPRDKPPVPISDACPGSSAARCPTAATPHAASRTCLPAPCPRPWPRLTSCFSMSSSRGELTKIVFCIKPTKHQKVSDSSSTSARMGATRSDMPCE